MVTNKQVSKGVENVFLWVDPNTFPSPKEYVKSKKDQIDIVETHKLKHRYNGAVRFFFHYFSMLLVLVSQEQLRDNSMVRLISLSVFIWI